MDKEAKNPDSEDGLHAIESIEKNFGDLTAVDRLSFDIKTQSCFGILGPNGAGKTTTLRMLLGQSPRSGGVLEIFGKDINIDLKSISIPTSISKSISIFRVFLRFKV